MAAVLAMEKGRRSGPIDPRQVSVIRQDFTTPHGGAAVDAQGTVYLGNDRFRTKRGEIFHRPAGI